MSCLEKKLDNLKVIVFDLDYTLWPFWVDTHVSAPFRRDQSGRVVDAFGSRVTHYPHVTDILKKLTALGYTLAVASRTTAVREARQLIQMFGWDEYLTHLEIYPGVKTTHMSQIRQQFGVSLSEILFFDDEHRNIADLNKIGVCSVHVRDGTDFTVVKQGIQQFIDKSKANH